MLTCRNLQKKNEGNEFHRYSGKKSIHLQPHIFNSTFVLFFLMTVEMKPNRNKTKTTERTNMNAFQSIFICRTLCHFDNGFVYIDILFDFVFLNPKKKLLSVVVALHMGEWKVTLKKKNTSIQPWNKHRLLH